MNILDYFYSQEKYRHKKLFNCQELIDFALGYNQKTMMSSVGSLIRLAYKKGCGECPDKEKIDEIILEWIHGAPEPTNFDD